MEHSDGFTDIREDGQDLRRVRDAQKCARAVLVPDSMDGAVVAEFLRGAHLQFDDRGASEGNCDKPEQNSINKHISAASPGLAGGTVADSTRLTTFL